VSVFFHPVYTIIIIINEFHREASLKENFRAAVETLTVCREEDDRVC